jgi:hypothetical protein
MPMNFELINEADRILISLFIQQLQYGENHQNLPPQEINTKEQMFPLQHQLCGGKNTLLYLFGDLPGSPSPVGSFSKRRRFFRRELIRRRYRTPDRIDDYMPNNLLHNFLNSMTKTVFLPSYLT